MALFAILSDDKLSIREIRDFPDGTVFKPGGAFPVEIGEKPQFDPATSELERVVSLPVDGVVKISFVVRDLSVEAKGNIAKLDALKRLFDDCEAIDDNWATATNAQKFELAQKTFRILRKQRRQILDQYRPE